jgi:hypothetical protein
MKGLQECAALGTSAPRKPAKKIPPQKSAQQSGERTGEPVNLIGWSGYRLEDLGAGKGLGKNNAGRNRKEKTASKRPILEIVLPMPCADVNL